MLFGGVFCSGERTFNSLFLRSGCLFRRVGFGALGLPKTCFAYVILNAIVRKKTAPRKAGLCDVLAQLSSG